MIAVLAATMIALRFTAPHDLLGPDSTGGTRLSADPVSSYEFQFRGDDGATALVPGWADSIGTRLLEPGPPGTPQRVWLELGDGQRAGTIYVVSRDLNGNLSSRSNACRVTARLIASRARRAAPDHLDVPLVKQSPERCGQAALEMVLRYYGAPPEALREGDRAYDRVLRGSLITDLAAAARRAGYDAQIETLTPESLVVLLEGGVPPILLYQAGHAPITVAHYGVVTGWDSSAATFTLNDGTTRPRTMSRDELVTRWRTAGAQALIVRRPVP